MTAQAARLRTGATLAVVLLAVLLSAPGVARAERTEPGPDPMQGAGLTTELGVPMPLDTQFKDETGRSVKLGDYFDGERPVIFVLVYFRCPMLCGLVLEGLTSGLKGLKWTPGDEFQIVALSFDPLERPMLAKAKKQSLVAEYGRPESASGWHILTGKENDIRTVTNRLGFHYEWNEETKEYMHPLVVFFCSPDGTLTHYSTGIQFEADELRRALTEAADGEIGSWGDRFLMACGHLLDSDNPGVMFMKVIGIFTVLGLGLFLVPTWVRSRRRKRLRQEEPGTSGEV